MRGNVLYRSYYTRGLTSLDITDSSNPVAAGRFDRYPSSDAASFSCAWGAYPFLPSGNIAISDADSGFYMVADKSLAAAQGSLSFTAAAFGTDETHNVAVAIQRTGAPQGAVSAEWGTIGPT